MFINKHDKIGKQIQLVGFFNPVYMFVPVSKYTLVSGTIGFDIYAVFGFRIMLIQK
jgi:hypothetical protein